MTRIAREVLPDRIVRGQPNSSSNTSKNSPIENSSPTIVNCVTSAPKTIGYRGSIPPFPGVVPRRLRGARRRKLARFGERERPPEQNRADDRRSQGSCRPRMNRGRPTCLERCQVDFPTFRAVIAPDPHNLADSRLRTRICQVIRGRESARHAAAIGGVRFPELPKTPVGLTADAAPPPAPTRSRAALAPFSTFSSPRASFGHRLRLSSPDRRRLPRPAVQ